MLEDVRAETARSPRMITEYDGDTAVVRVIGDLDMSSSPALREQVDDLLSRRPAALVVDFSGVRFLGSAGIEVLVATHHRAERVGAALAVVGAHRGVLRPLRATGVDALLSLHPTVDSALRAVERSTA
ncbi:STAS domain-containing protein [Umezawaea beigongshangensis]|uniref:STAS domain-containing protein n=1 Tax=Umezawaea beigongshangensis TaxID=2780383 RepID=UPI0018F1BA1F|nr:STAS domain-containing protein [Umezawaea beigongshangensis]